MRIDPSMDAPSYAKAMSLAQFEGTCNRWLRGGKERVTLRSVVGAERWSTRCGGSMADLDERANKAIRDTRTDSSPRAEELKKRYHAAT